MVQCIVVVGDAQDGHHLGLRNCEYGVYGLYSRFSREDYDEEDGQQDIFRKCKMWSCQDKDVPVLVSNLSKEWVGHEIKVFNLSRISTRLPGDVVDKKVTPDGVIPF